MSTFGRLLRFACVGLSVALIYIALYLAFLSLGWPQPRANALAFAVAVAVQYLAQALLTFRAPLRSPGQALRFVGMILCGFVTSAILTGLVAPGLGASDAAAAGLVVLVLPVQNYLIMAGWVFRPARRRGLDFRT